MKNIYIILTALLAGSTCFGQLQKANTVSRATTPPSSLPVWREQLFEPLKVNFDTTIKRYGEGSIINVLSDEGKFIENKMENVLSQKGQIDQLISLAESAEQRLNSQIGDINVSIAATNRVIEENKPVLNTDKKGDSLVKKLDERIESLRKELDRKNQSLAKLKKSLEAASANIKNLTSQSAELTKQLSSLQESKIENENKLNEIIKNNVSELTRLTQQSRNDKYELYKIDSTHYAEYLKNFINTIAEREARLKLHKDSLNIKNFSRSAIAIDSESVINSLNYISLLSANVAKTQTLLELNLKPEIEPLEKLLQDFANVSVLFTYPEINFSKLVDDILKPKVIAINEKIKNLAIKTKEFSVHYNGYADEFNTIIAKLAAAFKTKIEEQNNDVSVLGKITSPLNESGLFVPGFDVLAYRKFSDENVAIFGQAKFFVASSKSDTNKLNNGTRIFVPEASSLGFMVDFTFGFDLVEYKPKKSLLPKRYHSLGVNASIYYLQKQLNTDNKENLPFSIGMVQTRIGLEKTIVRNGLAVFVNLNGFFVGRGLDKYQQFYDNTTKMNWYVETGLKSYLKLTKDEKTNISFELRFIPVNPTVRKITQSSDKFIPLINVGVVRDFNF